MLVSHSIRGAGWKLCDLHMRRSRIVRVAALIANASQQGAAPAVRLENRLSSIDV